MWDTILRTNRARILGASGQKLVRRVVSHMVPPSSAICPYLVCGKLPQRLKLFLHRDSDIDVNASSTARTHSLRDVLSAMATSITVPKLETRPSHGTDANEQAFLQPNFDPADYLNNALPSLSTRSTQTGRAVPLPELSTQLQTLLSQLNAQTNRLSNTLTQLTDEIIRSGGRLAYEVEVLRGETTGLTDSLENGLRKDIEVFAPSQKAETEDEKAGGTSDRKSNQPEYLERLQTLSSARERLDQVIKTFGDAMAWPLAPSELSMTSSIISVSAPDAGDDARSREEKGKAYMDKVRSEINDLLSSGQTAEAEQKVEQMRILAEVWKGTAEEKARARLVEGLQKIVDEHKGRGKSTGPVGRKPTPSPSGRGGDLRYGDREGGYGFLKKLAGDIYLE